MYMYMICICILVCHTQCGEILFFETFCCLVKNENTKRPGFYILLVTRVFLNFPQLKQLSKMKNTCEYVIFLNCDLLEFDIRDSYKKLYCDYVSFRFLRLCFRVL